MKFFVPAADSDEEAERVYSAIAQFVAAPITKKRIHRLSWQHNGMAMSCEVGCPLPRYYQTGEEPALAIFDCGTLYKIYTPNRRGLRGEPVHAGKDSKSHATYFD